MSGRVAVQPDIHAFFCPICILFRLGNEQGEEGGNKSISCSTQLERFSQDQRSQKSLFFSWLVVQIKTFLLVHGYQSPDLHTYYNLHRAILLFRTNRCSVVSFSQHISPASKNWIAAASNQELVHDAVFSAISFGRAISKRELPGKAENWNTNPTVMDQKWNKIYLTKRASPSLDGAKSFVFHTIETFPIN